MSSSGALWSQDIIELSPYTIYLQAGHLPVLPQLHRLRGPHHPRQQLLPLRSAGGVSRYRILNSRYTVDICRYTLLTEICDERGRKYNYIVGRVVWVAALVLLPFIGIDDTI